MLILGTASAVEEQARRRGTRLQSAVARSFLFGEPVGILPPSEE